MPKQQTPGHSGTHGGSAPNPGSGKGGNGFAMPKSQTPGHSCTYGSSAPRTAASKKGGSPSKMPPNTTVSTAHPSEGGDKRKRQAPSVVVT